MCKIVILGVDGLSEDVYRELRGHGLLKSLASLEPRAVKGSIPVVPPLTPPAWTSILTGVNPGKHGVYTFSVTDSSGMILRQRRSLDVQHPRIHEMLSILGYRSFVVNMPFTSWPRIPFRGGLVSDWMAPRPYAVPEELNIVLKRFHREASEEYGGKDESWCHLLIDDIAKLKATLYAASRGMLDDAKLIFVMTSAVDALMHKNPDLVLGKPAPCLREALELVDELVDSYLLPLADNGIFIAVSDHGLHKPDYIVSIPAILYQSGLASIEFKSRSEELGRKPRSLAAKLVSVLTRNRKLAPLVALAGRKLLRVGGKHLRRIIEDVRRPTINPSSSLVIPVEGYNLYVNERLAGDRTNIIVEETMKALREAEKHKPQLHILSG